MGKLPATTVSRTLFQKYLGAQPVLPENFSSHEPPIEAAYREFKSVSKFRYISEESALVTFLPGLAHYWSDHGPDTCMKRELLT